MEPPRRPRGRGILAIIRIVSVLAALLFAFLLGTTIFMAVPPNLEVELPDPSGTSFTYANGVLRLDTSITVRNNGYSFAGYPITHDLTNVSLFAQTFVEGIEVGDVTSTPVDIPVGATRQVPVSASIALDRLQATGYLVFRPANLSLTIGGSATTTRGMLTVGVAVSLQQAFEPLISNINVDFANSTFANVSGGVDWRLPYGLTTADFLPGNASGTFTILNQTGGQVGNATEIFPLGGPVMGNLTVFITNESFLDLQGGPQDLTVQFTIRLPDNLTFTHAIVVRWDPGGP